MKKLQKPFAWEHNPYGGDYIGLTGYTGLDYHTIVQLSVMPAVRAQIGPRGLHKAGLAELPNGDLIAAPTNVQKYPLQAVQLYRSCDKGETWQPFEHYPARFNGNEVTLTCLKNGILLLETTYSVLSKQDLSSNEKIEKFLSKDVDRAKNEVWYSDDEGHTWHSCNMEIPELHPKQTMASIRRPFEQSDGTLSIIRCAGVTEPYRWKEDNFPKCRAWLFHSIDGGRTWHDREEIETWNDPFHMFVEADFQSFPDGRTLATSRLEGMHPIQGTQPPWPPGSVRLDHSAGHMVLMESTDGGRHWSKPRDFLSYSEVHGRFTLLKDGRLLCTYTNYHIPFGIMAVISSDYGKTWDHRHPFQLAISDVYSTGFPTTCELQDGTLLTIYGLKPYSYEPWEKGQFVCHCVRWELPPKEAK